MTTESKNRSISRREFFKDMGRMAGAGAVAAAAMPWLQGCSQEEKAMVASSERLGIAVIGTGGRGTFHLRILKALPYVKVVALCDLYEPHLKDGSELFPEAQLISDYRKVLEMKEVEAVIIATPLSEHEHITLDALDAGKHVFCEKSMALTCDGTLRMYNAYKKSGLVMFIGQQRLYDPVYQRGLKMIHDGVLGQVTGIRTYWFRNNNWRREIPSPELERQINWRLYDEYSAGLMTELASHQLQVGNWALGMIPEKVFGFGDIVYWKDGRDAYDNVSLVYKYSNGVKMTYESNIANKHNGLEEEILCNKGTMKMERGRYYLEETSPGSGIMQLINQTKRNLFQSVPLAGPSWTPEVAAFNVGYDIMAGDKVETTKTANDKLAVDESVSPKAGNGDGTVQLMEAFCHAAKLGRPVEALVEEAYYSTILALLGLQSMREQRVITFPEKYKIPYLKF